MPKSIITVQKEIKTFYITFKKRERNIWNVQNVQLGINSLKIEILTILSITCSFHPLQIIPDAFLDKMKFFQGRRQHDSILAASRSFDPKFQSRESHFLSKKEETNCEKACWLWANPVIRLNREQFVDLFKSSELQSLW